MLEFLKDYAYEMSELSQALTVFGAMIIAIALAIPIPIAVSIGTVIGYFMLDLDFAGIANSMYTGVEPFPLITVPLFVFAGSLMEQGGMARRIVNMAESLIGNVTGSLGLVAVLGCAFFAALSGSGPATTAAIGAVMIPSMIKMKYDPAFGGAIAAAGGALGSLIPPSNLMIIYGIWAIVQGVVSNFVAAKDVGFFDNIYFSVRQSLIDGQLTLALMIFALVSLMIFGVFYFLAEQAKRNFEEQFVMLSRLRMQLRELKRGKTSNVWDMWLVRCECRLCG